MSYASATDMEPSEGRKISPSNPTQGGKRAKAGERDAVIVFRCTRQEKQTLVNKARDVGLPFSTLLREALELSEQRKRRPTPRADPELIRSVSRIGTNINQIARWLNGAGMGGCLSDADAVALLTQLIAVERSLNLLVKGQAG